MKAPLAREEVPEDQTWNLGDLFASDAAWQAAVEALDAARASIEPFRGTLHQGAGQLLACLETVETLNERAVLVFTHAHLRNAQDGGNPAYQANAARVAALSARLHASLSFVNSEILDLPPGAVEGYLAQEPALADFRHFLQELLATRPHRLSAQAEEVLAALGTVLAAPGMVYNRSKSSDLKVFPFEDARGEVHPNSFNLYESAWEGHPEAELRRGAWKAFGDGLQGFEHTYAATFATEVQKNVVLARLRGHADAEDFLLQPHKVPRSLYTRIIDTIQCELAPHMQRYARLRQRVLGLDRLYNCDLKAPLDADFHPPVSYEDGCELILEALAVMGPDYLQFMRRAIDERWIDRANNRGKSSGAFCASPYGSHPFILMTWSDSMRNVFTLAHELGHAGHFGLAMRHQRLVNTRPAMPFVEAPSTMNEMLLARHILARSQEPRLRRSVILQVLGTYHHNFVTHLLEAELQRQMYAHAEAGYSITAAVLNQHKGDILQSFWGDTLTLDDTARRTWMRQPHYYMGLYPYTYSVGLVASTAMAQRVELEGAPAVAQWLEVLKAGGTQSPMELLQSAGIDLSTPEPIQAAVSWVGSLIAELEDSFNA
jgi:oligoendopeptidase F